jgi:hypothetical protein
MSNSIRDRVEALPWADLTGQLDGRGFAAATTRSGCATA